MLSDNSYNKLLIHEGDDSHAKLLVHVYLDIMDVIAIDDRENIFRYCFNFHMNMMENQENICE